MDKVPNFLGGTYAWDAEWVPAKVKAHKGSLAADQHAAQREPQKPAPSSKKLFSLNPFAGLSK